MKRIGIILCVLVVLLVGVWVGLGMLIRSDAFRGWLGRRVSRSLRAQGEFEPLTWSGATFRSGGFHAVGRPGERLDSLRLTGLVAHLDWLKLLSGQVVLDSVTVDRAEVRLAPARLVAPPGVTPPRAPSPGIHLRIHFSVQQVRVNHAFVTYESRHGGRGGLDDVEGITAVKTGPGAWELTASGGTIRSDRFPTARLVKAEATYSSHRLHLHPIELAALEGGTAAVEGEVQLNRALTADLRARLAGLPLARLPAGKEKIDGFLNIALTFQGDLNHFERGNIQGDFKASPVRYDLARYLGAFRSLARSGLVGSAKFDFLFGHLSYSDRHFLFTNLNGAYRGAARVAGTLEVTDDQRLRGLLQVGLKPALFDWVPGSLEAVFTTPHDGLYWTDVRVWGTVQNPQEDLSSRVAAALQDRLGRELKNQLKDAARGLRDLFK
ncbi:MAG: hypothetical protein JO069_09215 [Verrucomicrobia bacterium]|nr:hypothetical protein [Verrucomicrobiota bacterium]